MQRLNFSLRLSVLVAGIVAVALNLLLPQELPFSRFDHDVEEVDLEGESKEGAHDTVDEKQV